METTNNTNKVNEFRNEFEKTGELPAHLSKFAKDDSCFEDVEVPGFTA
jgi:hypothetical protein